MSEITFLEKDQLVGSNKLKIIKEHGVMCKATDLAAFQGATGVKKGSYYWTKNIIDEKMAILFLAMQ